MSAATNTQTMDRHTEGAVAVLKLIRPPVNALDAQALEQLVAAVQAADADPAVGAIVIASGIEGVYCAGGDLRYWPRHFAQRADLVSQAGRAAFTGIEQSGKPTVAAIQGRVVGDGLSLALACDIRIASRDTTLHLPEVGYGFIPGWGTIGRVLKTAGASAAAELLLVGEPMNAARAHSVGLLHQVTEAADVMQAAVAVAAKLADKPPRAMRYAKATLQGSGGTAQGRQAEQEAAHFAALWGGPEWEHGIERLFGPIAVGLQRNPNR